MAKIRPNVPILAICDDIRVARWMSLVWGVYPIMKTPHTGEFDINTEIDKACHAICDMGFANAMTDMLTIAAGLPWGSKGSTNILRVTSAAGTGFWFDERGDLQKYAQGNGITPFQ